MRDAPGPSCNPAPPATRVHNGSPCTPRIVVEVQQRDLSIAQTHGAARQPAVVDRAPDDRAERGVGLDPAPRCGEIRSARDPEDGATVGLLVHADASARTDADPSNCSAPIPAPSASGTSSGRASASSAVTTSASAPRSVHERTAAPRYGTSRQTDLSTPAPKSRTSSCRRRAQGVVGHRDNPARASPGPVNRVGSEVHVSPSLRVPRLVRVSRRPAVRGIPIGEAEQDPEPVVPHDHVGPDLSHPGRLGVQGPRHAVDRGPDLVGHRVTRRVFALSAHIPPTRALPGTPRVRRATPHPAQRVSLAGPSAAICVQCTPSSVFHTSLWYAYFAGSPSRSCPPAIQSFPSYTPLICSARSDHGGSSVPGPSSTVQCTPSALETTSWL
jgi:hypothetical protein